jgi:hypothetical protein
MISSAGFKGGFISGHLQARRRMIFCFHEDIRSAWKKVSGLFDESGNSGHELWI